MDHPHSLRPVVFVAFDDMQILDLTGPHEVFAGANRYFDTLDAHAGHDGHGARYLTRVVAPGGAVVSSSGLRLTAEPLPGPDELAGLDIDTLVLPGGEGVDLHPADSPLPVWVRAAAARSRRVAAVCSGTFLAARAGLLAGRRVTTHWSRADQLAREHPEAVVDADPIYVRDGDLWSSAGVTAGIDLALAIVAADHGQSVADAIARHLVMFLHRPGGQSQFAVPTWAPRAALAPIRHAQELVRDDPGADHRVAVLAARVGMSERHFIRRFADEVGEPPARYVERVRVEAARVSLERSRETVTAIARRCGFGTAETMRRAFVRSVGVPPDDYRRRFALA